MMKTLKAWLDEERGRYTALALHLGVSVGRVSQMAEDGVPPKFMLTVRDFTEGAVSLEALVVARTPGAEPEAAPKAESATAAQTAAPQAAPAAQRQRDHREQRQDIHIDKPSHRRGR